MTVIDPRDTPECLDRMLLTGERHLRLILSEYVDHYNSHRPHRALRQSPPAGRPYQPDLGANVGVLRRGRLGGLIHEYFQVAYGDTISGTHSIGRSPRDLPPECWSVSRRLLTHVSPERVAITGGLLRRNQAKAAGRPPCPRATIYRKIHEHCVVAAAGG
jgi:hypothetical protein